MRRDIPIGDMQFSTRVAAERHIRSILARYRHMESLAGPDLAFALRLTEQHPHRKAITGCGIRTICVQYLFDRWGARRFLIVRTDGSIRDFGWRRVLYPENAERQLFRVCRSYVREQTKEFRQDAFRHVTALICPITGQPVTWETSHADHIPPDTFEALVKRWLCSEGCAAEDIEIVPSEAYEQESSFEDTWQAERWKDFHREFARLRIVHWKANLSDIRKSARSLPALPVSSEHDGSPVRWS